MQTVYFLPNAALATITQYPVLCCGCQRTCATGDRNAQACIVLGGDHFFFTIEAAVKRYQRLYQTDKS